MVPQEQRRRLSQQDDRCGIGPVQPGLVMAPGGYRHDMVARLRRRNAMIAFARAFKPGTPGLGRRVAVIPRMIRASLRGEYDGNMRLLLMALASVYIVSPIDAIPEAFFLIFGLIDDAFVVTWLMGALLSETERFLEWEKIKGRGPSVVLGQARKS
jgi:uncharacterized membrane protein YkvA (DUF1232 family)